MNDSTADYTPRLFFSIDSVLPYPRSRTIDTSQRCPVLVHAGEARASHSMPAALRHHLLFVKGVTMAKSSNDDGSASQEDLYCLTSAQDI